MDLSVEYSMVPFQPGVATEIENADGELNVNQFTGGGTGAVISGTALLIIT